MTSGTSLYLRFAAVLFVGAILQLGFFAQVRVVGVSPDILLVIAIAGGLVGGEWRGAVGGFFAGLTLDLLVYGRPFGLAMLVYSLVGLLVGRFSASATGRSATGEVALAAVASALAVVAYDLGGRMLTGNTVLPEPLPVVALVVAGWTALFIIPVRRIMRWVWSDPERISSWAR